MKFRLAIFVLWLVTVASSYGDIRREIDHQYKRWAQATVVNDVDTILAILAPDYTLKTYTGRTILRIDYEASLKKRKASGKPASAYKTQIVSLKVSGPLAEVVSEETSNTASKDPITNRQVELVHIHRYLDTWIKGPRCWQLRSTVTTQESTKIL